MASGEQSQLHRTERGSGALITYGPASRQSQAVAQTVRRTVLPLVAGWRPTRRGIWIGRRLFAAVTTTPPLRGTEVRPCTHAGQPADWVIAPRAAARETHGRVVLYLHGGGFVVGSPRTHRNLLSRLSHVLATPVLAPDYRMAPEVSVRQSYEDGVAAYEALLADGYAPDRILVMGDSAGGGLAAGLCLRLAERGLPQPAALVLLSPWVDLANTGESLITNRGTESFIGGNVLQHISKALFGEAGPQGDWRVSPISAPAELLAQLPPTLVQVGGAEVLRDDGRRFATALADAGCSYELHEFVGQGHVVAWWTGVPEARLALRELARWLRDVMPDDIEPREPTEAALREATQTRGPGGQR